MLHAAKVNMVFAGEARTRRAQRTRQPAAKALRRRAQHDTAPLLSCAQATSTRTSVLSPSTTRRLTRLGPSISPLATAATARASVSDNKRIARGASPRRVSTALCHLPTPFRPRSAPPPSFNRHQVGDAAALDVGLPPGRVRPRRADHHVGHDGHLDVDSQRRSRAQADGLGDHHEHCGVERARGEGHQQQQHYNAPVAFVGGVFKKSKPQSNADKRCRNRAAGVTKGAARSRRKHKGARKASRVRVTLARPRPRPPRRARACARAARPW